MTIDYIFGANAYHLVVIRDSGGKVLSVEIGYLMTLLAIHHQARKKLSNNEFSEWGAIMAPKPPCEHREPGYVQKQGLLITPAI